MIDFFKGLQYQVSLMDFNMLLFLGTILFAGTIGGRLFQKMKVPQVVGYIIIGIILGQSGIRLISTPLLEAMQPISSFALGIIGFMIGGELKISIMKKYGKQFTYILLFEALTSFVIVSIVAFAVSLLLFKDVKTALALALILGSISSATAPAATTDVLWENKTRGPLTTMILGIVAMDDGVALVLFAITTSIASALLGQGNAGIVSSLLHLIYEIGFSLLLGSLAGYFLSKLMKSFNDEDKILVYSLSSLLLVIGISQILKVDMILASMSMGFFMSNFAPRKTKETFKLIEKFSPPIYILFFVLVGAKLSFSNLNIMVSILVLVYIISRTLGKSLGAFLGAKLSKAPVSVQKYLPFCLMSQAGVAIGLAIVAEKAFPGGIGDIIIMVLTTSTFVVQLIGPSMVKYAVNKAGEVGLNITEEDLIKKSCASDFADNEIKTILPGTTIKDVLEIFSNGKSLYYPVVNKDKKILGVITIENLKNTFMTGDLNDFLVAHDILVPIRHTCIPETAALEVKELLKKDMSSFLPVVSSEGTFQGMIEERSIDRFISKKLWEMESTIEKLG